jgi:hypothetical protein
VFQFSTPILLTGTNGRANACLELVSVFTAKEDVLGFIVDAADSSLDCKKSDEFPLQFCMHLLFRISQLSIIVSFATFLQKNSSRCVL